MSTLYLYRGPGPVTGHVFTPLNGGAALILGADADPDPDPGPEEPWDADLGVVGNRPALTEPPDATSTGPRYATTQTMTGAQARTAVLAAPVEADGYRYLRRTAITSGITFNSPSHTNIRFEDCTITGGGTYVITSFNFMTTVPSDNWPEFRFCRITGTGNTSVVAGGSSRFLRCDMSNGADIVKARGTGGEFYACYLHDNWKDPGGHTDTFQLQSGAAGLLVHWCNLRGFDDPASPAAGGDLCNNGVIQTGTITNNIGPVEWLDNWFDGGYYTVRGGAMSDREDGDEIVYYTFRRNKFGRGYRYGALLRGELTAEQFDTSNVFLDTGQPVLP